MNTIFTMINDGSSWPRPGSPPAAAQIPDLRDLRGDVAWAGEKKEGPGPVLFIVDVYHNLIIW